MNNPFSRKEDDITFRYEPVVRLVRSMGGDKAICEAARGSLGNSEREYSKEQNQGLISALVREGHKVPFEHVVMTWRMVIPIKVARQLVKYRLSSWSELSGRYRELRPEFFITHIDRPLGQTGKPMEYNMIHLPDDTTAWWEKRQKRQARKAWRAYQKALSKGITKEVARDELPVNTATEITWTMNLVTALHIISQRVNWGEDAKQQSHPMFEVEQVALRMWEEIFFRFPMTAKAFRENGYKL